MQPETAARERRPSLLLTGVLPQRGSIDRYGPVLKLRCPCVEHKRERAEGKEEERLPGGSDQTPESQRTKGNELREKRKG